MFPHRQPNSIMVAGMYLTLSDGNLYQVITLCLRGPRQLLLSSPNTKHGVHYGKSSPNTKHGVHYG